MKLNKYALRNAREDRDLFLEDLSRLRERGLSNREIKDVYRILYKPFSDKPTYYMAVAMVATGLIGATVNIAFGAFIGLTSLYGLKQYRKIEGFKRDHLLRKAGYINE